MDCGAYETRPSGSNMKTLKKIGKLVKQPVAKIRSLASYVERSILILLMVGLDLKSILFIWKITRGKNKIKFCSGNMYAYHFVMHGKKKQLILWCMQEESRSWWTTCKPWSSKPWQNDNVHACQWANFGPRFILFSGQIIGLDLFKFSDTLIQI